MTGIVAFFSLEYALDDRLPFAGGLGVLAANYLLECGQAGFPLVCIGLAYSGVEKLGFEKKDNYYFKDFGAAKLFLLDGGEITRVPYGPDRSTVIRQQAFLGFAGVKLLKDLGLKPALYHLNEGHTAFAVLALMKNNDATPVVATKHTVLSVSGLHLSREELKKTLDETWPEANLEEIYALGSDELHPEFWSSNKFLLSHAVRANGVSAKHVETEREVHQSSQLINITNGINPDRWGSKIDVNLADSDLWAAHEENRKKLVEFINQETGARLDPKTLTVVWARRLAEYKQPELIISDLDKLAQIPAQFIVAGAASPNDPFQQSLAERLGAAALNTKLAGRFVYFPHYNLEISRILVAGADVWLNTPMAGKEACGTSGMKAGLNGALLLSTPDGWVCEEDWSHGGGWILGDVYDLLKNSLVPLFSQRDEAGLPKSWLIHMRLMMNLIRTKYTTARMLEDYKTKLYSL